MVSVEKNTKKVFVKTLGCKVNTFDSQAIANQLHQAGYTLTESHLTADVHIINTCSVTATAEKEARYLLRRYRRENPAGLNVVTGCYAQIQSANLEKMREVDFVVPNEAKTLIEPLVKNVIHARETGVELKQKLPEGLKAVADNRQGHFKVSHTLFDTPQVNRARAFLKIQDGCNGFCAYCQIPYARGASTSVAPEQALAEVKKIAAQTAEIVLTGIHLGDYGEDLADKVNFASFVRRIFEETKLPRLRISSLEPSEVSAELLEVLHEHADRFCDHFHLPLQSGCGETLKRMRRVYTTEEYANTLKRIRTFFPYAQISADIIPGFPGESQEAHQRSVDFIKQQQIADLHVFPYSKRPNTAAVKMPEHLSPEIIRTRAAELRGLATELWSNYAQNFYSLELPVLWERSHKGRWVGKTTNYLPVVAPENRTDLATGQITLAKIIGLYGPKQLLANPLH
ncbi:MAG: tRNA (N(6)-L-threonylcarbamoyladenosine(37)-C(2))-methylthiotransferase MtaB [Zetaproteobacteria bacterium]|nr:tRNA (N(6)-L-threonylcarbamoyladenosine(37)-C(2))-methylthiotransferase MtaB [Zetaproteobacteria bacterium]